jgi:hypothetical protein
MNTTFPSVLTVRGAVPFEEHHSQRLKDLLAEHSLKTGESIPTEKSALVNFAQTALKDRLGSEGDVWAENWTLYRSVEIFNWELIRFIANELDRDDDAMVNLSEKIVRKTGVSPVKEKDYFSAFTLGILSLEGLYAVVCEDYEIDRKYLFEPGGKKGLAIELIRTISSELAIDYDFEHLPTENVTQIQSIYATIRLANYYQLKQSINC